MSQNNVDFSGNPSGSGLLDDYLDKEQRNILTSNSGLQRPSYAVAGTKWLNTSSTPWQWYMYDGTDDILLGTVNSTDNVFLPVNLPLVQNGETGTILTSNGVGQLPTYKANPAGVLAYSSSYTYAKNQIVIAVVDDETSLYRSLIDNNLGNNLSDDTKWEKVSIGGGSMPIGFVGYTLGTEVPNGGAWCDGAEYTKQAFPDIYQMLVDGKLQKTDYTTFAENVSDNGSCGFFALDTVNEKFKVPLLKDVYIKAGDTPSSFDASLSSSSYQDGAKVNPDHVVYRAYVVLYSSAAEASEAQAAEFMTALGGKANVGLDNVTPAQSFKDMSVAWNTPDYDRAVSISITSYGMEYVPQFDGYIEYRVYFGNTQHFFITGSGVSENSDSISGGALLGSTVLYLASSIRVAKGKSYYIFNTGTVQKLQFIPCKGVNTNA